MKKIILLIMAAGLWAGKTAGQSIEPFRDGDRAVFLGNSITDGGHYHSYIWLYYMTRFPDMDLRVLNAGIGGDTAADMVKRLDGDVFGKNPTVLTVTFGMNDSGYFEYNGDDGEAFGESRYRECLENFRKMEQRLKGLVDTRIIMMGSSPYDETAVIENNGALRGKNAVMKRIVEFQRASAEANGWEFLDLNEPMTAINRANQQKDPSFALCGRDRIHPDNDGHMVMAYLYLKAQGFAGRAVAAVEIDGAKAKVDGTYNCQITGLTKTGATLSFDYLASALPYPLDPIARGWGARRSQADAMDLVPFMEEMNRETLKVTGLDAGDYKLVIDGEEIGVWSSSDLAGGVNLAALTNTPQYRQALAVMYLNEQRWEREREFRDYAWIQYNFFMPRGLLDANNTKALEVLERERHNDGWVNAQRDNYLKLMHKDVREARQHQIDDLVARIYRINKPVTRTVTLRKI